MPRLPTSQIEVIAPNLKRRLSGVTATVVRLIPIMARQIGIVTTGPGLPAELPHISLASLPFLPRSRFRVWHARRNTEMVLGLILRALVAKLVAGGEIAEHVDGHGSFDMSHRIHVPLVTNDRVDFKVRGVNHKLVEGIAYEISNVDMHGVANRSDRDRIHFIFDYAVD